jgi:hypothetical protein
MMMRSGCGDDLVVMYQLSCLAYYSLSSRQFYLARLQPTDLFFLHEADLHPVTIASTVP